MRNEAVEKVVREHGGNRAVSTLDVQVLNDCVCGTSLEYRMCEQAQQLTSLEEVEAYKDLFAAATRTA